MMTGEKVCFLLVWMTAGFCMAASAEEGLDGHRLDWLRWTQPRAQPYLTDIRNLTDGDPETLCAHMDGPQTGGWIAFEFPEPVHVTGLRLMQTGAKTADAFELRCDSGESDEEVVATFVSGDPIVDEWIVLPVDRKVTGLRLIALRGNVGYRSPYPVYREIEIYTRDPVAVGAEARERPVHTLVAGGDAFYPELRSREIPFTPCIDFWMAGIVPGENMPETAAELKDHAGFQRLLGKLREIDAQGVRIFPVTYCSRNRMPWKSDLCHDYGKDTLRGFMDALHENGLTGSLFMLAWISPLQPEEKMLPGQDKRWDYPYEQSDLVAAKGLFAGYEPDRYPCILSEDDFRSKWLEIMKEAVECGVDGVYIMPDEYYFKGHLPESPGCPACTDEFRKRYGYDRLPDASGGVVNCEGSPGPDPRRVVDTLHYRKWKQFEYEMLAELFDGVAGDLAAINPELPRIGSANPASPYHTNRRMEHGLAFDRIGAGKNYTGVQLYASVPVGLGQAGRHTALARRMRGSHREAELVSSIQSLNFTGLTEQGNEIRFHGYLLPHIMNGATRIDLYRLNYIEEGHRGHNWWPVVRKGIAMTRLLEAWGITESESSARTCVLLSRASEDWWQLRAQARMRRRDDVERGKEKTGGAPLLHFEEQIGTARASVSGTAERALDFERFRGMYSGKCVESMLIESGVQYDVLYTDREETLENLDRYKVLVLPFSYAMSRAAFARIEAAVQSGVRVLVYDQLAPVDEFGEEHPEPLLEKWIGRSNVTFVDLNLAVEGMRPDVRAASRRLFWKSLEGEGGKFHANGARVEFLSRKTENGMILYLANWEKDRTAMPVIGLPLPEGRYLVTLSRSAGNELSTQRAFPDGQDEIAAAVLRDFSVRIDAGEVLLVNVERVPRSVHGREPHGNTRRQP